MLPAYQSGFTGANQEISVERMDVRGAIPPWLTGTLVRNGPGAFGGERQTVRHWFDGLAMLHKFSFHAGQVNYASRFLECDSNRAALSAGRLSYCEFATDPCRSLFQRVMTLFSRRPCDNAKVNVTRFADRYLALAETPLQIEFDPETLRSAGVFIHESDPIGQMTTAHPHFADDAMYNMVVRFHALSQYRLYRTAPDGSTQRVGAISTRRPAYMHSFGLSPNYAIVTAFPFTVNTLKLVLWLRPFIENYDWQPRQPTTFYVLNRHTGELAGRFESDPFFAFHHVNAFEEGGELVVDLVAYPDASIIAHYYLNRLNEPKIRLPHGNLRRYRLSLSDKRVRGETLSDTCIEMPRFDYERLNLRGDYRYVYGISLGADQPDGFYNRIVKISVPAGATRDWREPGCYPGEPVFVRDPAGQAEDAGVILSAVLDTRAGNSFLLVLDAATFTEIGRAIIPQALKFGFHSAFFPTIPAPQ